MDIAPRPRRYFALHFLLLRVLGLGWWHHPDEGDTRNFQGWYLCYSIATQIVWVVGFVGLETIDPFIGEKDIDRFMFSLSFVITHDLTLIKLYIFYFKNNDIQKIVRTLEIDLYDFYQDNNRNRATIRITKILTGSFLFFGWITIGNTNVYGTIQDIRWKAEVARLNDSSLIPQRTLPQPIFIPWNYQSEKSYISTFVLETVGLLWTGHIVMTIDTFIGSVILHMSSQFATLQEALVTAYDRTMVKLYEDSHRDMNTSLISNTNESSNTNENIETIVRARCSQKEIELALGTTLKNCLRQHQSLIGYSKEHCEDRFMRLGGAVYELMMMMMVMMIGLVSARLNWPWSQVDYASTASAIRYLTEILVCWVKKQLTCVEHFAETYSYGFMTQLLSSMAAICVVMVQVSQDASSFKSIRLVTSLAFFMAMIIQLAIQCFTGNELTLQASRIADAVMHSNWEAMSPAHRRLLLIMMVRSQKPLRLSAAGFAYMNNDCFLAIMKAAYSYYAVLSQKQSV